MANYKVKGWADLGAGGRTEVYAEGNTFQAAKANLEHLYPDVINVGTAHEEPLSVSHHDGGIVDKLFATAFPGTSPGVVFSLVGAGGGYVVADMIATRLTTNVNVATFIGLSAAFVCCVLGYVYARRLLIVSIVMVAVAIFAGLFWHLTRAANPSSTQTFNSSSTGELKSCSEWRAACRSAEINRKGEPKACEVQWNACMQSGRWTGPVTGRDYGPASKQ